MSASAHVTAFGYAVRTGLANYGYIYTWRTWVGGWLTRVLCQVAFFALIGLLIDSPGHVAYLLVGNAVAIAAVESCFTCASTTWERHTGTLPLLVAAPTSALVAFGGRSLFWVLSGTTTASLSLFILAPVFDVPMPMPRALLCVPLIALVGLSTYTFALFLSGLVLRFTEVRNVVGNVAHLGLMIVCGVQVPVTFWPSWLEGVATVLPLTHGLTAVREVLGAGNASTVLANAAIEVVVGLAWLGVAAVTFRRFIEHGRVDGSIDFAG